MVDFNVHRLVYENSGSKLFKENNTNDAINSFVNCWLSKYPKPETLHTEKGPQFTSIELFNFCPQNSIKKTFSSVFNPTSNALSEHINVKIAEWLRRLPGINIEEILIGLEFSLNNRFHSTLKHSPRESTEYIFL